MAPENPNSFHLGWLPFCNQAARPPNFPPRTDSFVQMSLEPVMRYFMHSHHHCGCNNTWTHHTPPNPNPAACHEPRLLPQTKQASWKTHFFTGLCKTMAPYSSIRLCPLPSQQKCRQFWSPQCTARHPTQTTALGVLPATN